MSFKENRLILQYIEKQIFEHNNIDYICRIYPIFKLKISLIELWIKYYEETIVIEEKELLFNFMKSIISINYISINNDDLELLEKLIEDNNDSNLHNFIYSLIIEHNKTHYDRLLEINLGKNSFFDDFLIIDPKIFANELTYVCAEYFKEINSYHFLISVLHEKYDINYNMYELIHLFEVISYIIPQKILLSNNIKYQQTIISYFIKVAFSLKKLNNFHMLFSICAGLLNINIQNIKYLWNNKNMLQLDELCKIIKLDRCYVNYRNILEQHKNEYLIPYLGVIFYDIKHKLESDIIIKNGKCINKKVLVDINDYLTQIDSYNINYQINSDKYALRIIIKIKKYTEITNLHKIPKQNLKRTVSDRIELFNKSPTKLNKKMKSMTELIKKN